MSNLARDAYFESSDDKLKASHKKELFGVDLTPYKVHDDSSEPSPPDVVAYKLASVFWNKFFGQKTKNKRQFWDNQMSAADTSKGAPTMFNPGFDVERDVVTSGYIL
jgi:hypothetical protein